MTEPTDTSSPRMRPTAAPSEPARTGTDKPPAATAAENGQKRKKIFLVGGIVLLIVALGFRHSLVHTLGEICLHR